MVEKRSNILLVEDDKNLGYVTKDFLEMSGFRVALMEDGKKGLDAFRKVKYDVLILDVMMPVLDGFSLAEIIRKENKNIPIIFLTAKSMKEDRIKGFKLGADDYITKPFSTEELKLRVEAILRRSGNKSSEIEDTIFRFGGFTFNYNEQLLTSKKGEQRLTRRESDVLRMLCQHKNKLLRRDIALKEIWGEDDYFMGRSMDVYITKLRKILKEDSSISIINIHNSGFKLEVKNGN